MRPAILAATQTGGAVSYSAEATALFARMSVAPDATRKGHIDTLIVALKAAGIWSKLDLFYILAAHDAQAARLNWVSSSFDLTAVNSPTFTADRGYQGDGATSYLDTGWDPATNAVNFARDNASAGGWSRTATAADGSVIGTRTAASVAVAPRGTGGNMAYRVNQSAATSVTSTDGSGLFTACRSASNATQSYRNGATIGAAGANASAALSSVDASLLVANSIFWAGQAAAGFMAANLSAGENTSLYNALQAYMTAVGA